MQLLFLKDKGFAKAGSIQEIVDKNLVEMLIKNKIAKEIKQPKIKLKNKEVKKNV